MKAGFINGILMLLAVLVNSCQDDQRLEFDRYYSGGSIVYKAHCQNCHGQHGEGLQGLIPPLTDSAYFRKNLNLLPCILQNGIKGKLTIANRQFDGQMPASGLTPMDITKVLNYITNSFGNRSVMVSLDAVNSDLNNCK